MDKKEMCSVYFSTRKFHIMEKVKNKYEIVKLSLNNKFEENSFCQTAQFV